MEENNVSNQTKRVNGIVFLTFPVQKEKIKLFLTWHDASLWSNSCLKCGLVTGVFQSFFSEINRRPPY